MASGRRERNPMPEEPPFKAYVGGLPYDVTQGEIEDLFKDLSIRETHMVRDRESDKFKGYAYVEFSTKDDLAEALTLNGVMYDGRNLRVDVAAPLERRGGGGRGGRGGGRGGTLRRDNGGVRGGQSDEGRGNSGYEQGGYDRSRERRGGFGGYGGGRRGPPPEEEFVAHPTGPARPRLNLKPRTTDPEELERLRIKEEEETKRRQAHICGVKD